ncbi:MAG: preprotein translocase subunit YajC [Peptococcaceae bacterium]|jgi:preprotein translocase subunit YajC|nr:preprotein translocase subunit YajC [Peptococcaceae bacterium]MBQ5703123.1 preprotein translocase subunit YajC [Peptococcaceae bacterium]
MGGDMGGMLSLLLVFVVFWVFLIKPQQKQAKQRAAMLEALKPGDKVVTIGGICGTVSRITDDKIFVEVSEGVVLEMLRNAISSLDEDLSQLKNPFEEDEDEDLDEDLYYDEDEDKKNA